MESEWYVEKNGKWHGPFSSARLKGLAGSGKLSQSDLIRTGVNSEPVMAGNVKGLFIFPETVSLNNENIEKDKGADVSQDAPIHVGDWYYIIGKVRIGPVSLTTLKTLLAEGQIRDTTRVWNSAMHDWVPAIMVQEIGFNEKGENLKHLQFRPPSLFFGILKCLAKIIGREEAFSDLERRAERDKIEKTFLPRAYQRLGEYIHSNRLLEKNFRELICQIDDIYQKITILNAPVDSERPTGIASKAKEITARLEDAAVIRSLETKLSRLLISLGKAAYERRESESGQPEPVQEIATNLRLINAIDEQIQASKRCRTNHLPVKRIAIGGCLVAVALLAFILHSQSRKVSDRQAAKVNDAQPIIPKENQLPESPQNVGFIDKQGKCRIPFRYQAAQAFSDGLAAVKSGGKWGYIDKTGAVMIPFMFSDAESFSGGLAFVYNDKGCLCIGKDGNTVFELPEGLVSSGREWDIGGFNCGRAVIVQDNLQKVRHRTKGVDFKKGTGLMGVVDSSGKIIVPPHYRKITPFSKDRAVFMNERSGEYDFGIIDNQGDVVVPSSSGFTFATNSRYCGGVLGFHRIKKTTSGSFRESGFLDGNGEVVKECPDECELTLPYAFFHSPSPNDCDDLVPFSRVISNAELRASILNRSFDKIGFLSRSSGKEIISPQFEKGTERFSEGLAMAIVKTGDNWKDRKCGFIDHRGDFVIPPKFDHASSFREGVASVGLEIHGNSLYGLIDQKGRVIVEPQYPEKLHFSEGLSVARKK